MSLITVQGIIIREMPYKETSKILTVITRELGRISVMVLGANRPRSRKGSLTQKYSVAYFDLERGRSFYYLKGVQLQNSHYGIRCDIKRLAVGEVAMEFIDRTYDMSIKYEKLYQATSTFLSGLATLESGYLKYLTAFQIKWIALLGYQPNLFSCVNCGKKNMKKARFSISLGGLVCEDCKVEQRGRLITKETLQALIDLMFTPFDKLDTIHIDYRRLHSIHIMLYRYMQYHIDIPKLKSWNVCYKLLCDGNERG